MSLLTAKIENLTQASSEFGTIIEDLKDHEKRLEQLINEIGAGWEGSAKVAFVAKMHGRKIKLAALISYLAMLKAYSDTTANTMHTLDQLLRKMLGNISPFGNSRSTKASKEQLYYIDRIVSLTDGKEHTRAGETCKGYANWVYYQLYGVDLGQYKGNRLWELNSSTATQVGSLSKVDNNLTYDSMSALIGQAQPGDAIQLVWKYKDGTSQHSMIFKEFQYDSNGKIMGFYTLEGNNGDRNSLANLDDGFSGSYGRVHYYSLETFYDKLDRNGCGFSVNHAKNYDQIAAGGK